ncbi:MAG: TrmH family RNA methyltransferase [Methylocystaceae bacterium]
MQLITSPENEYIRQLKKLKMKKYRETTGLFLAEGVRLVTEALQARVVQELLIHEDSTLEFELVDGVNLIRVSDKVMKLLTETETSQGVLAVCRTHLVSKPEQLAVGPWVAVDNLADPGNLGTIIRTAWGTGMCGVILLGDSVDPYNSKVVRASMGGIFHVPVIAADSSDILSWQMAGHQLVVATAEAATSYAEASYAPSLILVVGSEAHGVSPEIEARAELAVSLPLQTGVDSINAAVCAGVLMYEIILQRR